MKTAVINEINIDISSATPPTLNQLAQQRKHYNSEIKNLNLLEQKFNYIGAALAGIVTITILVFWLMGDITGLQAVVGAGAVLFAGAAAATFVVVFVGVGAAAATFVGEFAGAVLFAGAAAATGAFAGAIVAAIFNKFIVTPLQHVEEELASLVELEASEYGEQCIQYIEWCEKDSILSVYQNQIVALGRKPVLKEYDAAKNWIDSSAQRASVDELQEKARVACSRMQNPIHAVN
jgi:hypothetical protein